MDLRPEYEVSDDFEENPPRRIQTKLVALLLAALIPVGYTMAGNINLGSSKPVEFGQGVVTATSCDDQISIAPKSSYLGAGGQEFILSSLTISDIANACINKPITINLYSENSAISSNTYGPISFVLSDSGTAGLHFELVGENSSLAVIGDSTVDTLTAGMGANGNFKYLGKSKLTFTRFLSNTFTNYDAVDAVKYTLQSSDRTNLPPFNPQDVYTNACLSVSSTNYAALTAQMYYSNSKVDSVFALVDFSNDKHFEFIQLSSQNKSLRAHEYSQLAIAGTRISSYMAARLLSCVNRMTSLASSETDLNRQTRMYEIRDATNAAIDASLSAVDSFNALQAEVAQYL